MKFVDYKCEKCENITEKTLQDTNPIPKDIECEKCSGKSLRVFSLAGSICHQGKCGNKKTGYTSNPRYVKKT